MSDFEFHHQDALLLSQGVLNINKTSSFLLFSARTKVRLPAKALKKIQLILRNNCFSRQGQFGTFVLLTLWPQIPSESKVTS